MSRLAVPSVCLGLIFAASASARDVTFQTQTYADNNLWSENSGPNGHVRADLNGDGREDFISENDASFNSGCKGSFAVTLSTGDGEYAAPICYTIPSGVALYFAVGDFDHRGTLDVAVTNDRGNLYIFRNAAGDGKLTLATNVILAGEAGGIVAGDVNHDGLIDLVYLTRNGIAGALHVLFGTINGTFSIGPATTFTIGPMPSTYIAMGDFDGDSRADILITNQLFYGNGDGTFTPGPSQGGASVAYQAFDLDSDGTMDLIGAPFKINSDLTHTFYNYLDIEWGHSNRTLTGQQVQLKSCTIDNFAPQAADFDGDGVADLIVAEGADCQGNGPYTLNFMKGHGDGTFEPEQVIYSTSDFISEWHVFRASHSSRADLTVAQFQLVQRMVISPQQLVLLNTTAGKFPSCTPPNFQATGISVCGPSSVLVPSSPVHFSFAGSNDAPGRDMQIWVDGQKVAESLKHTYTFHDFVDARVALSKGQHRIDIFSVGWDYKSVWDSFSVIVGESVCPIPNAGLNICSPISNSQLTSRVTAYATSHGNIGWGISRMEIWVDGLKMYSTFGEEKLKTELTLNPGWHLLTYYAIGTDGSKWQQNVWAEIK